jgi:hypothetical protein
LALSIDGIGGVYRDGAHLKDVLLAILCAALIGAGSTPRYTIQAIRFANHDGIDPEDVELVKINTEGRLHLIDGDDVEVFPGIRAYTGGRHTYSSQYLRVGGGAPFVLASDNVYLYPT